MSMGKPVITTDTAGCSEAVEIGRNGFLAEVRDTQSLIETFQRFIQLTSDQRHEMGLASRQKALNEFDDRKIASDIYSEIEKVFP